MQPIAPGCRLFKRRESQRGIPVPCTAAGQYRWRKGGRHADESTWFFPDGWGTAGAALVTALGRPEWLRGATTARKASDVLELGPDKIKVTRMAIGLGTNAGNVQRELGLQGVADYLKFAFDQGQFFWDTADAYKTHPISSKP